MDLLPTTLGTRPRVAVEVRAEGVVAARAEDAAARLVAVARVGLVDGAVTPGLKVGNFADRAGVVAALRKTLEAVADKTRGREVTLILPDSAARVLFLDFDALPGKTAEAMPLVRFRLKKLIPFETDAGSAAVSYQVMSSAKGNVRVLAVAVPREVLAEYEGAVREAGFEPGAVLPSTLSALAGMDVSDTATLVVNAGAKGVTTAIVQGGVLLLHRSVDMTTEEPYVEPVVSLPLVDHEASAAEWAQQEPLPVGVTAVAEAAREAMMAEPSAVLEGVREELRELARTSGSREVAQAVSVAAAYFEDTLGLPPGVLLSAGSTGAARLGAMLRDADFGGPGLRVEEMVAPEMVAASTSVSRCWLAGVRGALKS
jgi:type IV pilus assembly protein PilM